MVGTIVTLTFSPTLDIATDVDVVRPSSKLRCAEPRSEPGGGGINVARVATRLGCDAVAVAPLGGEGGRLVIDRLVAEGVVVDPVLIERPIRTSFSVTEDSTGRQFRFVLPPHPLEGTDAQRCIDITCERGRAAGCVVVSGGIDVPNVAEVLRKIVELVRPTPVIIDTSAHALDAALNSQAALLKPSARELSTIVGRDLDTERDITAAAVSVVGRAAIGALLVSIGAGGALLVRRDLAPVRFRAPTVQVRSTIGAGDSLVAGIATGLARGSDLIDAIRHGIAAGTATVLTEGTALCDPAVVSELFPFVTVDP